MASLCSGKSARPYPVKCVCKSCLVKRGQSSKEARKARCRRLRLLGRDLLQPQGNQLIRCHFGVQILARSVKVDKSYLEFNRESCRYALFSTLLPRCGHNLTVLNVLNLLQTSFAMESVIGAGILGNLKYDESRDG